MYDEKSFYSIDRLVEFGMGLAVAQQMTQSEDFPEKKRKKEGAV
jgi:hypothetical protein